MSLLTFPRRPIAGRYRGKYQAAQINCEFDKRFYRRDNVITRDFKLMSGGTFSGGAGYVQALAKNGAYIPVADGVLGETDKGLGLWEARTNYVRNPTGLGAVAGSPGTAPTNWAFTTTRNGVSARVSGVGVEFGLPYVEFTYSGTASANTFMELFTDTTGAPATLGSTWTHHIHARLVSGTAPASFNVRVFEMDAGGAYLAEGSTGFNIGALDPSRPQRLAETHVTANASVASTRAVTAVVFSTGAPANCVIRQYAPNLKLGADISDPPVLQINNAEATRTSNIPTITNIATLVQNPFTLFVECELNANANDNRIMVLDDSSGNDSRLVLRRGSDGRLDVIVISNNVTIGTLAVLPAGSFPGVALLRAAITWTGTQFRVSANGSAIASITAAVPVGVNVINLGYDLIGGVKLNGWYRTFAAFPFTMSDAQIQDITAVA